jgi:hypothetical protein
MLTIVQAQMKMVMMKGHGIDLLTRVCERECLRMKKKIKVQMTTMKIGRVMTKTIYSFIVPFGPMYHFGTTFLSFNSVPGIGKYK